VDAGLGLPKSKPSSNTIEAEYDDLTFWSSCQGPLRNDGAGYQAEKNRHLYLHLSR
jgi:hypothetical protein